MQNFELEIKQRIDDDKELFYNSSGNTRAYQLGVKHIGCAKDLAYTIQIQDYLIAIKEFYLVDFTHKTIEKVTVNSQLKLIELSL